LFSFEVLLGLFIYNSHSAFSKKSLVLLINQAREHFANDLPFTLKHFQNAIKMTTTSNPRNKKNSHQIWLNRRKLLLLWLVASFHFLFIDIFFEFEMAQMKALLRFDFIRKTNKWMKPFIIKVLSFGFPLLVSQSIILFVLTLPFVLIAFKCHVKFLF